MAFRKFGRLLATALTVVLTGCSMAVFNIITPRSGYTVQEDVAYGASPQQKLDIMCRMI